jgi:putative methionine-R-sulfoxide reductase with GAF domain
MDERGQAIRGACEQAVRLLAAELPGREVACLIREQDVLRHAAQEGGERLIYEIPRDLGGVTWRAADSGETQLVRDVTADPDYLASNEDVRSEIAVPVSARGEVVAVLDVESRSDLGTADVDAVRRSAERLAAELARLYDS